MPPITTITSRRPHALSRNARPRSAQVAFGWRGKLFFRAIHQVVTPRNVASTRPGTMPAMNSAPTDVLVATAYITITIDGGIRIPSAPDVVMTPAPKRGGKPCRTIAGRMIEPMATTVAGELPETAANSAHAITPARPRPPAQWPTIDDAKAIIRRATPP